ncbi:LLM class flavin-dependent oxidoreductase [Actinocorallia sp. A-T 12471]|uniref:LLM class flavin-dependent oxidoreductase n=1 Tax=Actinocorallia sp. A-T 12471 TaxID=3089813 RepID=UPI0029CFDB1D|nr:LLM class flavin-dependent oxidoreductase [Actinocorallia sp. A-T 12471]MDX6740488.1 LLM class flavin-dependent oxidoreductase [Actinocorallia sp. A-T 12471]
MNVGVVLWPVHEWPEMGRVWQRAEELGFHTGWLYDHLAWRGHSPWDEALTSLAAAAATTSRIRLGTLVTSPNFRHPLPTAHAIKTLDRISGGRITVGVGAGGTGHTSDGDVLDAEWSPKRRADRYAEWVGQLDALLTESPVTVRGEYWAARDVTVAPGLVQLPRPPFYVAGEGPRGMRLAVRHGQGWIANPASPDEPALPLVRSRMAWLAETCEAEGRDFKTLRKLLLTGFTADPWTSSLADFTELYEAYADAGITDVALHWPRPGTPWAADDDVFAEIAQFCRERSATPEDTAPEDTAP